MFKFFMKINRKRCKRHSIWSVYSSLLSMILCMVFLAGTSMAWFTATETLSTLPIKTSDISISTLEVWELASGSNAAESSAAEIDLEEIVSSPSNLPRQTETMDADVTLASDSDWSTIYVDNGVESDENNVDESEPEWIPVELELLEQEIPEPIQQKDSQSEEEDESVQVETHYTEKIYTFNSKANTHYRVETTIEGTFVNGFLKVDAGKECFYAAVHEPGVYRFSFVLKEGGRTEISVSWGLVPDGEVNLFDHVEIATSSNASSIATVYEEGMDLDDVWILDEEVLDELEEIQAEEDVLIGNVEYYKGEVLTCACIFHCEDEFADQRCQLCSIDHHGCWGELSLREACICGSDCDGKSLDEIIGIGCEVCVQNPDLCMGTDVESEKTAEDDMDSANTDANGSDITENSSSDSGSSDAESSNSDSHISDSEDVALEGGNSEDIESADSISEDSGVEDNASENSSSGDGGSDDSSSGDSGSDDSGSDDSSFGDSDSDDSSSDDGSSGDSDSDDSGSDDGDSEDSSSEDSGSDDGGSEDSSSEDSSSDDTGSDAGGSDSDDSSSGDEEVSQ